MTDKEIDRRIAAILGWVFIPPEYGHYGKMTYPKWRHPGGGEYVSEAPPPYSRDWEWCGPLVQMYSVSLLCGVIDQWAAVSIRNPREDRPRDRWGDWDKSAPRAICLAVISSEAARTPV